MVLKVLILVKLNLMRTKTPKEVAQEVKERLEELEGEREKGINALMTQVMKTMMITIKISQVWAVKGSFWNFFGVFFCCVLSDCCHCLLKFDQVFEVVCCCESLHGCHSLGLWCYGLLRRRRWLFLLCECMEYKERWGCWFVKNGGGAVLEFWNLLWGYKVAKFFDAFCWNLKAILGIFFDDMSIWCGWRVVEILVGNYWIKVGCSFWLIFKLCFQRWLLYLVFWMVF